MWSAHANPVQVQAQQRKQTNERQSDEQVQTVVAVVLCEEPTAGDWLGGRALLKTGAQEKQQSGRPLSGQRQRQVQRQEQQQEQRQVQRQVQQQVQQQVQKQRWVLSMRPRAVAGEGEAGEAHMINKPNQTKPNTHITHIRWAFMQHATTPHDNEPTYAPKERMSGLEIRETWLARTLALDFVLRAS